MNTLSKLCEKDKINIDPDLWGGHGWIFLYSMAFAYPNNPTEEEKADATKLITSLRSMLACMNCKNNYKIHLAKLLNNDFNKSKKNLIMFLVDMENAVNVTLGKKRRSYDEAVDYYHNKIYKKNSNYRTIILIVIIALLLFVIYV